jgi:hypothetical protein
MFHDFELFFDLTGGDTELTAKAAPIHQLSELKTYQA